MMFVSFFICPFDETGALITALFVLFSHCVCAIFVRRSILARICLTNMLFSSVMPWVIAELYVEKEMNPHILQVIMCETR